MTCMLKTTKLWWRKLENIDKWKDTRMHELEVLMLLKCSCYKVIYRENAAPIKISMASSHKKIILKFIWSYWRQQIAKAVLSKIARVLFCFLFCCYWLVTGTYWNYIPGINVQKPNKTPRHTKKILVYTT